MDAEKLKQIFTLVNKKTEEKNNKIKSQESELEKLRGEIAKLSKKEITPKKLVVSDADSDEDEPLPKPKAKKVKEPAAKKKRVLSDEAKEALRDRLKKGKDAKKQVKPDTDSIPECEKKTDSKKVSNPAPETDDKPIPTPKKETTPIKHQEPKITTDDKTDDKITPKPTENIPKTKSAYYMSLLERANRPKYY